MFVLLLQYQNFNCDTISIRLTKYCDIDMIPVF